MSKQREMIYILKKKMEYIYISGLGCHSRVPRNVNATELERSRNSLHSIASSKTLWAYPNVCI